MTIEEPIIIITSRDMCGIVGYIGQSDAFPVLIEGLKRLEYRGYDSAGVAVGGREGKENEGRRRSSRSYNKEKQVWGRRRDRSG